jgi:outer membrane protein assembly factor BamB
MLATLSGVRQILVLEGARLTGYSPTGAGELWSFPWLAGNDINVAQPLVLPNNRVFVTSGYASRCGVVHVVKESDPPKERHAVGIAGGSGAAESVVGQDAKLKPEDDWNNAALRCRFCSPVLYHGWIYGLDEGILTCLDQRDGRRVWRGGRYRQGQLLRSEDLLLIMAETGELALVQAAGPNSQELGRIKVLPGDKNWNCPCLAGGKAFIRNHEMMACYDLRE